MNDQISITDALGEILAAVSGDNSFPDPDYLAYHQLLKERIIYLETPVEEPMLRIHKQILMWNAEDKDIPVDQRKPIRIVIFLPNKTHQTHNSFIRSYAMPPLFSRAAYR